MSKQLGWQSDAVQLAEQKWKCLFGNAEQDKQFYKIVKTLQGQIVSLAKMWTKTDKRCRALELKVKELEL